MKILVTGSRDWVEPKPIERELSQLPKGTILVHGACRGVDNIAADIAKRLGFVVRSYPVLDDDWEMMGPVAGHLRNQKMLDDEHPDEDGAYIDKVFAWHEDSHLGKGTRDMIDRCEAAQPSIDAAITIRPRRRY